MNAIKIQRLDYLKDIKHFDYIKLATIDDQAYGLVAGFTNTTNPDIEYTTVYNRTTITKADLSKKILLDYGLEWNQKKIILITDTKDSRENLLVIEKDLQANLGLLGS